LRPNDANSKGTYRVPDCDTQESLTDSENEVVSNSDGEIVFEINEGKWKNARIKLDFAKGSINFELRYFKPRRSGNTVLDLLPDHLATAAEHGREIARALAPGNAHVDLLLTRTAKDHATGL